MLTNHHGMVTTFEQQLTLDDLDEYTEQEPRVADSKAIPFEDINNAISRLEVATHGRVMLIALALTGCRIQELDNFRIDGFLGNRFYWHVGKNQKGRRCVIFPQWYIDELRFYRNRYSQIHSDGRKNQARFYGQKLFGQTAKTFTGKLNKELRQFLPHMWREKVLEFTNRGWQEVYRYQLRGFRKTWATHFFFRSWIKTNSPVMAMEWTAKEMRHSTKSITVSHYIEDVPVIKGYAHWKIEEIISPELQQHIKV